MKNVPKKTVKKTMSKQKKLTVSLVVIGLVLVLALTLWLCLRPEPAVMECGDFRLTNRDFSYHYWTEVMYSKGAYEDYLEVDFTKPLSEQPYDDTKSWEDHMIDQTLEMIQETMALAMEAEKEGFTMPQDYIDAYDDVIVNFQDAAMGQEYENVDAYLQSSYGDDADLESFETYLTYTHLASAYADELYARSVPTEEDVQGYYEENADYYGADGLEQARDDLYRDNYNNAIRRVTSSYSFVTYRENISLTAPEGLYE